MLVKFFHYGRDAPSVMFVPANSELPPTAQAISPTQL